MVVGAGLYMYDVVVKKSSRSLSHLLMSSCIWFCCNLMNKSWTESWHSNKWSKYFWRKAGLFYVYVSIG